MLHTFPLSKLYLQPSSFSVTVHFLLLVVVTYGKTPNIEAVVFPTMKNVEPRTPTAVAAIYGLENLEASVENDMDGWERCRTLLL